MAKKLWGGRFEKETDPLVEKFTNSIKYDSKLAMYDLIGSMYHIKILEKSGYLTPGEKSSLMQGLSSIFKSIRNNTFKVDESYEDVHSYIQDILEKQVGEAALKLHMARSRNDQVVFATKVYCKDTILSDLKPRISELISALRGLVNENDIIIPGFTHLQHAQPVYLKDYLGAYIEMLHRDESRLSHIATSLNIVMGAGALAGTPIDSSQYRTNVEDVLKDTNLTELLEIKPTVNSLDSVSDRDFIIEIICALSIIGVHLSRLSEDFIIWSTKEFDFIEIDEAFCTGSSLMPQKKNPDVLELVRGYSGRIIGNLVSVLTLMKGLPLTYNRDMQLDKEPLFNSFEVVINEIKVLTGLIKTLKFNKSIIDKHLLDESLYATDLVYYLVEKGEPFSKAHAIVGELIRYVTANKTEIKKIPEDILKEKFSDKFIREGKDGILRLFDPKVSVESKKSIKR